MKCWLMNKAVEQWRIFYEMSELMTLRQTSRERLSSFRSIDYIIQSDSFGLIYNNLLDDDKNKVNKYISEGDKDALKDFMNKIIYGVNGVDEYGIRRLRQLAKELHIIEWWTLNKLNLIREIKHEFQRLERIKGYAT